MKNLFRQVLCFGALSLSMVAFGAQKNLSVKSPGGNVEVRISLSDRIYFDVISQGETLLEKSHLGLELEGRTLGLNPVMKSSKQQAVNEVISPIFPLKRAKVDNNYTLLTMKMKGDYVVQWRVYDDGAAYRIQTSLKDSVNVLSEDMTLCLAQPSTLTLQQPGGFKTSCEENYTFVDGKEWKKEDKMSEVPIIISTPKQRILFSEFDLFKYPGLFLRGNADNTISAIHPKCPLEFAPGSDRSVNIAKEADYIARVAGTRDYPWRYFQITQDDRKMAESTMPDRLAPKCAIDDVSWIRTGKTTWDWLNGRIVSGPDVDFHSGVNLETYKYHVDFAAEHGLEYILIDEGWAQTIPDPFTTKAEVKLPELIKYAKQKNVGVVLWLTWLTVNRNMSLFEKFEEWGIKGVKIDFMDRQDQWMVNFYEEMASEAAKHHIFIDFHGAYHPSGLSYKYPNVLTFEGVRGVEFLGSCKPDNTVYLPFVRNAVGPMDFTPGLLLSMQPDNYARGWRPICASMGTRAFQLAVFVLFESNLQMLADTPSRYRQIPDCTEFLAGVPVNWDETKVLLAEYGQYIITAKRRGDTWFIGGITNNNARNLSINLDFLASGKTYKMTSFIDGPNADMDANDYRRKEKNVDSKAKVQVEMVRNGGFAAVLKPM